MPIARSTPDNIVAPPGCNAQSKSVAFWQLWGRVSRDERSASNAGSTAAAANLGTRGERTTFHPNV